MYWNLFSRTQAGTISNKAHIIPSTIIQRNLDCVSEVRSFDIKLIKSQTCLNKSSFGIGL